MRKSCSFEDDPHGSAAGEPVDHVKLRRARRPRKPSEDGPSRLRTVAHAAKREAIQQPAKVSIGLIVVGSLVTGFVAALADATHESLLLVPTDAAAATKAIRDVVTSVRTSSPLN